jgi:hypothetical protein
VAIRTVCHEVFLAVSAAREHSTAGWELFAQYAFPPNELGYCGPPDSSKLLPGGDPAEITNHAQGFDGAWAYMEAIAEAAAIDDPLDTEVVRNYWVGGPLLDRVDPSQLLDRLRGAFAGQPTGLLTHIDTAVGVCAHHSFQVLVVYPWVQFLDTDPGTPLKILQDCRIRWGIVDSVDGDHVILVSRPLSFDGGVLTLADPVAETVRWSKGGTSLAPVPVPGDTATAHWDWICGRLDEPERAALAKATQTTLDLVNRAREHSLTRTD